MKQVTELPLLAIVHLRDTSWIRCKVVSVSGSTEHKAPIPLIPLEALKKLEPILAKDNDIKVYLAFMPSWEPVPQRDPILMVELGGEFVAIHSWGGDRELLEEYIIKKD